MALQQCGVVVRESHNRILPITVAVHRKSSSAHCTLHPVMVAVLKRSPIAHRSPPMRKESPTTHPSLGVWRCSEGDSLPAPPWEHGSALKEPRCALLPCSVGVK